MMILSRKKLKTFLKILAFILQEKNTFSGIRYYTHATHLHNHFLLLFLSLQLNFKDI